MLTTQLIFRYNFCWDCVGYLIIVTCIRNPLPGFPTKVKYYGHPKVTLKQKGSYFLPIFYWFYFEPNASCSIGLNYVMELVYSLPSWGSEVH